MSEFSEKCKAYLFSCGSNVYQFSMSTGLDRTTMQRMVTGKRLPNIDFVKRFCQYLRINTYEQDELLELYYIEKLGRTTFQNRKCIFSLFSYIKSLEDSFDKPIPPTLPAAFTQSLASISVEMALTAAIEPAFKRNDDYGIATNIRPTCTAFYNIIKQLWARHQTCIPIRHFFRLHKNPADANSNANLEKLYNIIPFAFSNYNTYYPHYYYSKAEMHDIIMHLYPYYVITDDILVLISADLKESITTTDPAFLQNYKKAFEDVWASSFCLIQNENDYITSFLRYHKLCSEHGIPRCTLEAHPCLSAMLCEADLDAISSMDTSDLLPDTDTLKATFQQGQQGIQHLEQPYTNYFTYPGFQNFVKSGTLLGVLGILPVTFSKEQRRKMLDKMLHHTHEYYAPVLLKESTGFSPNIHVELYYDNCLSMCQYCSGTFKTLFIQESSISQAFLDFFQSLQAEQYSYTPQELETLIQESCK